MSVYIVLLEFSTNKAKARELMPAHNAWIARGFDEGVFLAVGSMVPALGGALISHGVVRAEIEARMAEDPFVAQEVVSARVIEVEVARADARLRFVTE